MKEISLEWLLQLNNKYDCRVKVRFNQYNGYDDPMELYKANPDEVNNQWLFWRTEVRNFSVGDVAVCLLKIANDRWLLTTIKHVTKEFDVKNGVNYEGEEIEEFKPFFGRIIVTYHKDHQTQCCNYSKIQEKLVINQILPDVFDGEDFPGYDKVRLSYQQLRTIINAHKKDWVSALQNQKAVYLITDTNNGKLYVGSATSENGMLLTRWNNYVCNGHGGNVGLMELVKKEGFEYTQFKITYSRKYEKKEKQKFKIDAWGRKRVIDIQTCTKRTSDITKGERYHFTSLNIPKSIYKLRQIVRSKYLEQKPCDTDNLDYQ